MLAKKISLTDIDQKIIVEINQTIVSTEKIIAYVNKKIALPNLG